MTHEEIDSIIERYHGKESAILAILQDIQAKEKYLPKETLEHLGERVQNVKALADAVAKAKPAGAKGTYIQRVAVSSTMGPGVKVEPSTLLG